MKTKRLLAALLTFVMLLSMVPTISFAAVRLDDEELPAVPVTEDNADSLWVDAAPSSGASATLADTVDLSTLVNIASTATLAHSPEVTGQWLPAIDDVNNLVNGDYTDQFRWIHGGVVDYINDKGVEPSVTLTFEENQSVGGFKLGFFKNDSEAGDDYTYHILGKAKGDADYTELASGSASKASDNCVKTHALPALRDLCEIKVALTDQSDNVWPILAEIEVLAQLPPLDLTGMSNIAADATLSHSPEVTGQWLPAIDDINNLVNDNFNDQFRWIHGGVVDYINDKGVEPSVTLSFGENRSVAGFTIGIFKNDSEAGDDYAYHILGKAAGDADYRELFSGTASKASDNCVKTHAFSVMTNLSEIKVAFTNQSDNVWPILSEIQVFGEAKSPTPSDKLIEVASLCPEISVPSNESAVSKMLDGKVTTWWAADSGSWPANVDFTLPGNMLVKRVEVDFEHFDGRTFNLTIARAVNNVTSDYQDLGSKDGHSANETYVLDLGEGQRMTHVRVALRGTNGQAWPAIAEVRIYALDETVVLDDYADITSHATATTEAGYKEWDFHGNQQIVGFRATVDSGVTAVVKGRMKRDSAFKTYIAQLQSGDNVFQFPQGMSVVRVELSDPTKLTSFQIFGTYTVPVTDYDSAAFEKPAHGNYNAATTYLVNDGDLTTGWKGDMYPAYVDIDLEENYNITEIQVVTPADGYTEYVVYTSMDGRDFETYGSKLTNASCPEGGDKFTVSKEARIVRVYIEYYSESEKAILNEVRVLGTPSNSDIQKTPDVNVGTFAGSKYDVEITDEKVITEVQGIVTRQLKSADYVNWFTFALAPKAANGYDYFDLTMENGKVKITGNNGVSLATGLNHYLKYYCNVNISQVGSQIDMPASIVPVETPVHKETKFPVRYAYNYCTHSYSMAFWGEDEWRNELDWLALNGVNVVLDITGQEEVWREFLMSVGYTHEEAKDFLAGPGYYAWAYMANLTGFGGPIHDSFLEERVDLGRKNQLIMRTLGMEPVLQAFSGMVPVDIETHDPNAQVIAQGKWCSFQRPTMLKTDTATYDEYAAKFYTAQKKVFGDAKYYATDPFHEGGNTGGMSGTTVASELLDSLLLADKDAIWVIQSWQGNPTTALLAGLRAGSNPTRTDRREHALVLDLWAEHSPHNNEYGEDTD
ncbi:MAG: alpha-N-acetylglucosaminidase N-terminal domain-containing protein, partial [Muribaculaceae bacterium]|nr:alpha-N-acetylglucosaminidase N-terminal domain-containing protein [Muribaculaceae bacterium]